MNGNLKLATESAPSAGEMTLYAAVRPPLRSGAYLLEAEQEVLGLKEPETPPRYQAQQRLNLSGTRFTLADADVQMVYPAANMSGNFGLTLPNIVLRRRTLPWERTLDGSAASPDTDTPPWLALLTLYPGEYPESGLLTLTTTELLNPPAGTLGPEIDPASLTPSERGLQLYGLDLEVATFQAIAPRLEDLPYLAHVREVNTGGKELLGLDLDGWFSVVFSNRLPQDDALNQVVLVSLEGQQNHLPGNEIPAAYSQIRLNVLAAWRFTAEAAVGDFIGLMQAIPERGGIALIETPHESRETAADEGASLVQEAIALGYTALPHLLRSGETSTSWYRGPFSAVPTKADPHAPYFFSDAALQYDPDNGLFDTTYAAAFQIARLLALSDAPFTRALFDWRLSQQAEKLESLALSASRAMLPEAALARLSSADSGRAELALGLFEFIRAFAPQRGPAPLPRIAPRQRWGDSRLPGRLDDARALRLAEGDDPLQLLLEQLAALRAAGAAGAADVSSPCDDQTQTTPSQGDQNDRNPQP